MNDEHSRMPPAGIPAGIPAGLPASRAEVARLIPHQGHMCLLERVLAWDTGHVVATTRTHLDPAHPLRGTTGLRAIHLCEYGAQAAALHGGLIGRAQGQPPMPGLLAALRDVELRVAFIHGLAGELRVTATRLLAHDGGSQYQFEVVHADTLLARGRVSILARRQPPA